MKARVTSLLGRGFLGLGLLALLLLLYFLSVGPANWLIGKTGWSEEITPLYGPFMWVYDHTPLRHPLDLYLDLWDR